MEKFRAHTKYVLHKSLRILGVIFLFAGLVGLVFPIIPGIPLLILAIIILGEESIFTGWLIRRLPPKIKEKIRKITKKDKDNSV